MISKFASLEELNRIEEIVKTLKKMTDEKEEAEIIELKVKDVSALIDDLNLFVENVRELNEKVDETKTEKGKKDDSDDKSNPDKSDKDKEDGSEKDGKDSGKTKDASDSTEKVDEGKEKVVDGKEKSDEGAVDEKDDISDDGKEKSDEDKESQAKYRNLCEEYSKSLGEAQTLLGVKDEIIAKLTTEKAEILGQLSKFEQEKVLNEKSEYDSSLKTAVETYAKFNKLNINDTKVLDQKQKWITSKMSKVALVEIGEAYGMQVMSKLSKEQKVETTSSENLSDAEETKEFSKLSKDEQLDAIAERVAKAAGFRG